MAWRLVAAALILLFAGALTVGEITLRLGDEAGRPTRAASQTVDMGAHRMPVRLVERGEPGGLLLLDPVEGDR